MQDNINQLGDRFVNAVPNVLGAILVLLIGYIVAKGIKSLVTGGLRRMGLDRTVSDSPAGKLVGRATSSPSSVVGAVAYWTIFLGAISLAVSVLGIDALNNVMGAVYSYLPNVLAAFAILVGAVVISAAVSGLVSRLMGDTPTGKMVAGIVPGIIFSMAVFMVLNQLQIAPAIVTITYAALLGAIALGSALAFGLGGRDVAARMLQQAYTSGQQRASQARHDLALGRQRAASMASDMKNSLQDETEESTDGVEAAPSIDASPAFGESLDSFKRRGKRNR